MRVPRQDFDGEDVLFWLDFGLSQREVALQLDVPRWTIEEWIKREKVTYTLFRICSACGKRFEALEAHQKHCGTCGLRRCFRCGRSKPLGDFDCNKANSSGRANLCRECKRLARPQTYRRFYLKRWGLTEESIIHLWESQNRNCPICLTPLILEEAVMDHDHSCHAVGDGCPSCRRGLTHRLCNQGIGMFGDDPVRLRLAADYLDRWRVNGTG